MATINDTMPIIAHPIQELRSWSPLWVWEADSSLVGTIAKHVLSFLRRSHAARTL